MPDSLISRRDILAAGSALATLSATAVATGGCAAAGDLGTGSARNPAEAPQAPFDSLRDYVAALDAHGLLLRIPEVDQDAWQATGLVFRANDKFTYFGVPALYFDKVKIGGKWVQGPLLGLLQANLHTDAIVFGQQVVPGDGPASYRNAKAWLADLLKKNKGSYPEIPPVAMARDKAPCKQVVLTGDAIDLTRYAFVQTNPVDGGRYVNTGSVFMNDPVMGGNFGTYRCQLKGPRLLGLNPEPGQTGWKMLNAARKRGEATAKVAIALGQDPVVWFISGTRVANRFGDKPVDELALAGGFRGKPVEVVKCETSDLMVPAHAEMIIEGEVPLQAKGMPEGPFGEMFGYMGPYKEENFFLNVTAVTHRRDPWIINAFTGMQRGMVTSPQDALYDSFLKRAVPGLIEIYQPQDLMGVAFISIDKKAAGEGMKAGRIVAERNPIAKVVIVVDKDVDVMDRTQVLFAVGSRWQPSPAAEIFKDLMGIITDPSQPVQGRTSKIVIDATIQLPEEGGRKDFPATNRALLEKGAPAVFAEVDRQFGTTLAKWGRDAI
ncbi:MAG: UbiD family decarboxylase [Gammaproteobacteria bacterium]|jgi:4-hydroxy-3-polyprenylbenzoate decarboxylase|nr:UbiD family decarboxylase [Gammaproteobacteria bacterium]